MKYKTLILKEGTKYQEYLHYYGNHELWGTSSIPYLHPITSTLDLFKSHYPNLDLTDVTLATVEIKIIKE